MRLILQILIIFILSFEMTLSAPLSKASSKPSSPLTLKQAQDIALKQHPEILASKYRLSASEYVVKEVDANYLPQINLNGVRAFSNNNARIASESQGIANSLILDRLSYGVSASQLITDFGRTGYLSSSAKDQVKAQAYQSLSIRERVVFEVTSCYYNVLRAQKILEVALKTQKARQLLFDKIYALQESQLKSSLDVSMASQLLYEAKQLVLNAENNLDKAWADLSKALGFKETKHFILKDTQEVSPLKHEFDHFLKQAQKYNPEINKIRAELSAAQNKYSADQASNYPSINAFGYAGETPLRDKSKLDSSYGAAGINLSFPVFTGGRITAIATRSKEQMNAVIQDLVEKDNKLSRDIRVAWDNAQTAYENIKVSQEIFKTSTESLILMQERYAAKLNSIVDLSQVELSQTQAEIAYSNAIYDYVIHLAFLAYLVGSKL